MSTTRRTFLARSASAVAATAAGYSSQSAIASKNDRPTFGLIGAGWQPQTKRQGRGIAIGSQAAELGDVAEICELDTVAAEFANQRVSGGKADLVDDYRRVLDNQSIDAVLIATPDHWHAKIAIEAMRAGKDVYCEKPVAVTIEEGKWLRSVAKETGRVFQVGTQQRSEYDQKFLRAIAMVRDGRVGKLRRIHIGLDKGWRGGPFQTSAPPKTLNWERWLGPAPMTGYIPERTHRTFRWWYEYAGGQLCDWGAHHVDIAQWAIGQDNGGPISVEGTATMNQPLHAGMPTRNDTYNTPIVFLCHLQVSRWNRNVDRFDKERDHVRRRSGAILCQSRHPGGQTRQQIEGRTSGGKRRRRALSWQTPDVTHAKLCRLPELPRTSYLGYRDAPSCAYHLPFG